MELKVTRYTVDEGLATITLSRPQRRNAWTGRMHTEYRHLLALANSDPVVRVVIVTGDPEGKAFCAGADLGGLEKMTETGEYNSGITTEIERPGYGVDANFDATFAYHFGLDKPVIAAMNGAAAGVGLVLAAFCDLRFAVPGAKFTTAHGRFNMPAEYGLSWLLPRQIGLARANDLLLTSRVFQSEEALSLGFINGIHSDDTLMPAVTDYAHKMADGCSPGSLRATRHQVYRDLHGNAADAVVNSEELLNEMTGHADYKEGVKAWMEKRKPDWSVG